MNERLLNCLLRWGWLANRCTWKQRSSSEQTPLVVRVHQPSTRAMHVSVGGQTEKLVAPFGDAIARWARGPGTLWEPLWMYLNSLGLRDYSPEASSWNTSPRDHRQHQAQSLKGWHHRPRTHPHLSLAHLSLLPLWGFLSSWSTGRPQSPAAVKFTLLNSGSPKFLTLLNRSLGFF